MAKDVVFIVTIFLRQYFKTLQIVQQIVHENKPFFDCSSSWQLLQNIHIPALIFMSLNKFQDQGNFEIRVSSNSLGQPDCLIKCGCMETSKKKRSCSDSLSTDAEEWLSTRTDERCAKLLEAQRHGKVFVMNKIKRQ